MSTFSNIFFSETTGPIEAKFHMEPPWDVGTEIYSNGPGHMTEMVAMSIYGKKLKNLLIRNQKSNDCESWYAASGARSNDCPGLTLTYFTARSNLIPYAFVWETVKCYVPGVTRNELGNQNLVFEKSAKSTFKI